MRKEEAKEEAKEEGYSLIEMLIAMLIFAVVITVSTTMLATLLSASSASDLRMTVRDDVDFALDVIKKNIYSADPEQLESECRKAYESNYDTGAGDVGMQKFEFISREGSDPFLCDPDGTKSSNVFSLDLFGPGIADTTSVTFYGDCLSVYNRKYSDGEKSIGRLYVQPSTLDSLELYDGGLIDQSHDRLEVDTEALKIPLTSIETDVTEAYMSCYITEIEEQIGRKTAQKVFVTAVVEAQSAKERKCAETYCDPIIMPIRRSITVALR